MTFTYENNNNNNNNNISDGCQSVDIVIKFVVLQGCATCDNLWLNGKLMC